MSLPMNTRPDTTVGCAKLETPAGKAKAHFSLSFGTSAAVMPASFSGWKREFVSSTPQPFQCALFDVLLSGGLDGQWFGICLASASSVLPTGRPVMKCASLFLSASDRLVP